MRKIKLTRQEKAIEEASMRGEYRNATPEEFEQIASAIAARRKDTVLHIRINGEDLKQLKNKAARLGIKYQTFVSEILHRVAHG